MKTTLCGSFRREKLSGKDASAFFVELLHIGGQGMMRAQSFRVGALRDDIGVYGTDEVDPARKTLVVNAALPQIVGKYGQVEQMIVERVAIEVDDTPARRAIIINLLHAKEAPVTLIQARPQHQFLDTVPFTLTDTVIFAPT